MGEALKEIGKHLLNIAVAIIVFIIIQPAVIHKIDKPLAILGIFAYFIIIMISFLLIKAGKYIEKKEETGNE